MTTRKIIKKIIPKSVIQLGLRIITSLTIKYYSRIFKPLIIRNKTTDSIVFRAIFIFKEFKLPNKIKPKVIIDAGAYTGLSSLYFSHKYPNAKIYSIEPEESNFDILKKHTEKLDNITIIKAGLWHKDACLKIVDRHTGKFGFMVEEVSENDDYDIKSITIDYLINTFGIKHIDILKIDIEGAEKELFSYNYEKWLPKVSVIVIELHDKIKQGCTETLFALIDKEKWLIDKVGEKVVLINKLINY